MWKVGVVLSREKHTRTLGEIQGQKVVCIPLKDGTTFFWLAGEWIICYWPMSSPCRTRFPWRTMQMTSLTNWEQERAHNNLCGRCAMWQVCLSHRAWLTAVFYTARTSWASCSLRFGCCSSNYGVLLTPLAVCVFTCVLRKIMNHGQIWWSLIVVFTRPGWHEEVSEPWTRQVNCRLPVLFAMGSD